MNIDTLKIYNELKSSGVSEEQAQAQAMAICHANRVTPEDLMHVREDFKSEMNLLIQKVDINFNWLFKIGYAGIGAVLLNITIEYFKK